MAGGSNDAMLKLMTAINVSAAKPNRRKRALEAATYATLSKKGKGAVDTHSNGSHHGRPSLAMGLQVDEDEVDDSLHAQGGQSGGNQIDAEQESDPDEAGPSGTSAEDAFHHHFASEQPHTLPILARSLVGSEEVKKGIEWSSKSAQIDGLGQATQITAKGVESSIAVPSAKPHVKALEVFKKQGQIMPSEAALVSLLGSYRDIVDTHSSLDQLEQKRRAISLHVISHITKTRRRVLRNNERIAKAAATGDSVNTDLRDQGFTRPKALILLPLRNSALSWMHHLSSLSGCSQVDNAARFDADFTLPEGTVDKLLQPETRAKYPADHIETFKGNIDDNFRIGAKLTRKSWRMYSQFYDSDVIIASPLGLRLAIEKDRDSDFLSSIEVLVADQLDVMLMQNWEHVEFVLQHMNKIPKEAHGADFSRIKQWYLDSLAPYLRQTILLSSFDSPEIRKLMRFSLNNVAGKVQLVNPRQIGVMSDVRTGIRQTFQRFQCSNVQLESNLRLETFLNKTLPTLQKSALSSSRTLIFVPSYLDFLQLQEALRTKHPQVYSATAMLTEYSEGPEIARNRARFMTEKKKFLIVTERFVFYRRYVLRGARTIVCFGLPDHPLYYAELLENVFKPAEKGKQHNAKAAKEEEEVDAGDVSAIALFCQYDFLRLERIVGSEQARRMVGEEKNVWRFT